jgi:DNA-binding transcriptional ArsR family regulator
MGRSKRSKKKGNMNHKLIAALRHPLRREILRLMSDGREASPCELAELLNERLSNVAYHVRVLVACGALKPTGQRKVRGGTEHFYSWSLEADWARAMLDADEEESSGGKS